MSLVTKRLSGEVGWVELRGLTKMLVLLPALGRGNEVVLMGPLAIPFASVAASAGGLVKDD